MKAYGHTPIDAPDAADLRADGAPSRLIRTRTVARRAARRAQRKAARRAARRAIAEQEIPS